MAHQQPGSFRTKWLCVKEEMRSTKKRTRKKLEWEKRDQRIGDKRDKGKRWEPFITFTDNDRTKHDEYRSSDDLKKEYNAMTYSDVQTCTILEYFNHA